LLALLLACGLRRHEAANLKVEDLQQREEHWAIVDLVGKAGHIRTVPVPDWVYLELVTWLSSASIDRGRSSVGSAVRVECSGAALAKRPYGTWSGLPLRKSESLHLRRTT
jgi:integrase